MNAPAGTGSGTPQSEKAGRRNTLRAIFVVAIALLTMLLIIALTIPSLGGMYDRAQVAEVIRKLEQHREVNDAYPASLEVVEITTDFCNQAERGIDYRISSDGRRFTLSCFGRGPVVFSPVWESYDSETGKWTRMNE